MPAPVVWSLVLTATLQTATPLPTTTDAAGAAGPAGAAAQTPTPPPAPTWTDDRPLTRFFPNLARDIAGLATVTNAAVSGAGLGAALAVAEADGRIDRWSAEAGDSAYADAGSAFGSGWVQAGGAVATYVVGRMAGRPQVAHVGSDLVRAQALNAVVTHAIKLGVDRTRPSGGPHAFPSGHTSATFASAAVLQAHYGWKTGLPAYAGAGLVGWSRVRDRHHWLSDVAFGAVVGIVAGRSIAAPHRSRRLTIVPVPIGGGLAVFVSAHR